MRSSAHRILEARATGLFYWQLGLSYERRTLKSWIRRSTAIASFSGVS